MAAEEYLRRNLLVAKAVGAREGAARSLQHLRAMKRAPKWLIKSLEGIHERAAALPDDLVMWRETAPDHPYPQSRSEKHSTKETT